MVLRAAERTAGEGEPHETLELDAVNRRGRSLRVRVTVSAARAAVAVRVSAAGAVAASIRRPEGDLLITGGGFSGFVNLAFLLLGVVTAAFAVGRVLAAPVSRPRSGSGSGGAR